MRLSNDSLDRSMSQGMDMNSERVSIGVILTNESA